MIMSWRRVLKSAQALAAHTLLFCFTLLLLLKLDHVVSYSWWTIFFPLWMFHGVVARGRFSLPAPSVPHNRQWAPCHAIVATPLLIAFELLLCIYLESVDVYGFAAVNLKVVFLPLLAFEIIILVDNFRMCRALMPGDDESISDEAVWETLPVINSPAIEAGPSTATIRYLDWNSGFVVAPEEDQQQDTLCGLQEFGGHLMKIPIIGFQVLLCMHLEGTPSGARDIPLPVLFSPLFLLQGLGVLFSASMLIEKIVLLLRSGAGTGFYFRFSSRAHDCMGFFHHGSRLLGWWSIDEGSREEQARLYHDGPSGFECVLHLDWEANVIQETVHFVKKN